MEWKLQNYRPFNKLNKHQGKKNQLQRRAETQNKKRNRRTFYKILKETLNVKTIEKIRKRINIYLKGTSDTQKTLKIQ